MSGLVSGSAHHGHKTPGWLPKLARNSNIIFMCTMCSKHQTSNTSVWSGESFIEKVSIEKVRENQIHLPPPSITVGYTREKSTKDRNW